MYILQILNTRRVIDIRYASIRELDISNGEGVGISLFVQGCPEPHCKNCFNPETWDFNGGKEWTEETEQKFFKLIDRPYIKRISILGGEPLANQNLDGVLRLTEKIRVSFPNKTIWLYSGYSWNSIFSCGITQMDLTQNEITRQEILRNVDVFVDGQYIDELRDISLAYRGSKNQNLIDVRQTLKQNRMVLYCD